MRTLARHIITLGVLAAPASAAASEVIAFGDEWATGAAAALQTSLTPVPGALTVADWGANGFTAQQYATSATGTITQALAANPDARWMWLSVGWQDLVDRAPAENAAQIASTQEANLRTILNTTLASRPDLRIVMFGYDYPNYVQDAQCQAQLATDFGATATQLDVNTLLVTAVGAAMQTVADEYPNVTYVSLYSTLQTATSTPADATQPSPASLMADCTHPNPAGYAALTDALVAAYWSQPVPTAQANASATTICSGDVVTFDSLSANNEGQVWRLEGTVTSTQPTWMAAISGPGAVNVTLEAYNFAWTDTATVTLTVNDCTDAGVVDTGVVDSGVVDSGVVDAGPPDTGVFPDAAVDAGPPDTGVFPDAAVDAGPPDTGVFPDAAVDAGPPDTGVFPDAAVDAGPPDTGVFPDAAVVFPDAEVDAGPEPDAEVDAGLEPDAEVDAGPERGVVEPDAEVDAGPEPDTGVVEPDAGVVAPDAGVVAPDAGATPVDAGTPANVFDEIGITGDGCSCETERSASTGAPSLAVAIGLLALGLLRRRR